MGQDDAQLKKLLLSLASGILTLVLCLPFLNKFKSSTQAGTISTPKAALYGWAFPPNQEFSFNDPDSGQPFTYRTNSQGWKDVEHSFVRDSRKRILVIGDSFTWGLVPMEQQYTRVLERLTGHEVISVAMCGWGTDQELTAYETEGRLYHPDIVILQFCFNDIGDNIAPADQWHRKSIYWNKPFRFFVEDGRLEKYAITKGIRLPDFHDGDGWNLTSKILVKFRDEVESSGARFVIFDEAAGNPYRLTYDPHERLKAICKQSGIAFVGSRAAPYERFRTDPHTNVAGNYQMAEDLELYFAKVVQSSREMKR